MIVLEQWLNNMDHPQERNIHRAPTLYPFWDAPPIREEEMMHDLGRKISAGFDKIL